MKTRGLSVLALVIVTGAVRAQPPGALTLGDTPSSMTLVRVFNQLTFGQALQLVECPDGSGRIFVVNRPGTIQVFDKNNPVSLSTVLTIPNVGTSGEEGCLSMAFDPDYATNGEFYVYYVRNPPGPGSDISRIARFTNDDPADNTVDPATEEAIIEVAQPANNHNGGMIAFGPDNMLYWGLGDGGGSNGQFGHHQNTTTILGSFLRIDVHSAPDAGLAYHIPTDNPFFAGGPAGASTRKEIWAYGFRNPFRWSFDIMTGQLFCGDVGQEIFEEVDVIESGGNYGWNFMEGFHCFDPNNNKVPPENCDQTGLTLPIAEYNEDLSDVIRGGLNKQTITGGHVYYGSEVPELYGVYLYCDYEFGRFFGLRYDGTTLEGPWTLIGNDETNNPATGESSGFAGIGQDVDGEVYFIRLAFNSEVYVLRPLNPRVDTGVGEADWLTYE
jgi:glucose/arabinose dehydrogenase